MEEENEINEISFLDQSKLNELNKKVDEGKITCNIENPEQCENCGSWSNQITIQWEKQQLISLSRAQE